MTGLVLVHGIGEQKRGTTFEAFFAGLCTMCPSATQVPIASNAWRVTIEDTAFTVYEAYWADLLSGDDVKGTFDIENLFELAWYPSINHRIRDDFRLKYPKSQVRFWTATFVGLMPFVYLGHDWGLRLLLALVQLDRRWEKFLDQVPGDVINFVNSAGDAYRRVSQVEPERAYRNSAWVTVDFDRLAPKAVEIMDRFLEVLDQATRRDGCTEIHVLAHSLGTVVVHQALARATSQGSSSANPMVQITRLYTIGCPLERIRFFWPKLFEKRVDRTVVRKGRAIVEVGRSLQWENFWSRSDAVSSRLSSFPGLSTPENYPAKGLGGFFTAHVRYFGNREFLRRVLNPVKPGLAAGKTLPPSMKARVISTLQNLLAPFAFLGFACLGLIGAGAAAWGTAWVWATLFDWIGRRLGWGFLVGHFWWLKWFMWCGFANIVFLSFTLSAKSKAENSQRAYWGPVNCRAAPTAKASTPAQA